MLLSYLNPDNLNISNNNDNVSNEEYKIHGENSLNYNESLTEKSSKSSFLSSNMVNNVVSYSQSFLPSYSTSISMDIKKNEQKPRSSSILSSLTSECINVPYYDTQLSLFHDENIYMGCPSLTQVSNPAHDNDDDNLNSNNSNTKTALYKTELCKRYMQYGTCRYGIKCQFAHGTQELRHVLRHPKYKTTRCKSFWSTGQCPYGIRCRFIHEEESNQLYSIEQHNLMSLMQSVNINDYNDNNNNEHTKEISNNIESLSPCHSSSTHISSPLSVTLSNSSTRSVTEDNDSNKFRLDYNLWRMNYKDENIDSITKYDDDFIFDHMSKSFEENYTPSNLGSLYLRENKHLDYIGNGGFSSIILSSPPQQQSTSSFTDIHKINVNTYEENIEYRRNYNEWRRQSPVSSQSTLLDSKNDKLFEAHNNNNTNNINTKIGKKHSNYDMHKSRTLCLFGNESVGSKKSTSTRLSVFQKFTDT